MNMTRRKFLKLAVGGGIAAGGGFLVFRNLSFGGIPSSGTACGEYDLGCIANHLVSGGPPKDGIPAINNPSFVAGTEAEANRWISDNSLVDAVVTQTGPRAYPRSITVWHEIVNDTINGEKASLTYCPLTGSSIILRGKAPDGSPLTFGTTGRLYNSNLVMYDRQTDSMYPQILGIGISGPNKGMELEQIPVTTTTWGRWKRVHPDSEVLSRQTGSFRNYDVFPYGDYDSNNSVYFPVAHQSSQFSPKKLVIGARAGTESVAVLKDELKNLRVANLLLAGEPVVGLYDDLVDNGRLFSRTVNGDPHSFAYENSKIVDVETSTTWDPIGQALEGPLAGAKLREIPSLQVMWFGWYAFHPTTAIFP